jgi:WhiB family transcriptional regulator, redox-sensing transcriptional regulator
VATEATSSWWNLAACRSADPELFFPISSVGAGQAHVAKAKAVCATCSICQRCLDYAIESHQAHGVWGGTSEDERRPIAARRLRGPERVPA